MVMQKDQKLKAYKDMLLIREFETKAPVILSEGYMFGEPHQYIGEEAVAVGISSVLNKEDSITSTHRGHGHLIAKGGDVKYMFAELGGRTTGYCKGKGGSMHITSVDLGIYGANGMVGQGPCIAVGVAYAAKLAKDGSVVVTYFGDGASSEGSIHEAMNMASILQLPLIFVCENNKYAITTNADTTVSVKDISIRAAGYNMPGVSVDGMDVEAVHEAALEAVERARRGDGPSLIECKTYRYCDHHNGYKKTNTYVYRPDSEVEEWKEKDPIPNLRKKLLENGDVTEQELLEIEAKVTQEIEDGVEFMKQSPIPEAEDAYADMYSTEHYTMPIRGW